MRIIVDAMGGDNAPLAIVKGALQGQKRWGVDITLTGDETAIREALAQCGVQELPQGMDIVPTTEEVTMEDDPATVFRRKKDSSMGVGLTLVRGIRRAAMAPVMPTTTGRCVLIDCGANAECTPEYLLQFAYLGSFYARHVLGIENPRVGLLNIGVEAEKGTDLQRQTRALLLEQPKLNFIGNIEAKEAIKGGCDVLVTDGFSGNVMLKTIEGIGSYAGSCLKGIFKKNLLTKLAGAMVLPGLNAFKAQLDPNKVGGTAFIGISKPVIKAHGSSNDEAIENAIGQAREVAASGLVDEIAAHVDEMTLNA